MVNFFPLQNLDLKEINPINCGEEICAPGHSFGPFVREYYLLHYVVKGKGIFQRDGKVYPLRKGQIFVIRPGETTYYEADEREPWHYIWIGFDSNLDLPGLLEDVLTVPECEHIFVATARCGELLYSRELYICGKIYELLALIDERRIREQSGGNRYVLEARQMIQARYHEEISVQALADALSLDRSYFSALFKKHTGKSPQRYLVDFRLEMAAQLMAHHLYSPQEAAQRVGYQDLSNFSKMFKKRFGISPRGYLAAKEEH